MRRDDAARHKDRPPHHARRRSSKRPTLPSSEISSVDEMDRSWPVAWPDAPILVRFVRLRVHGPEQHLFPRGLIGLIK